MRKCQVTHTPSEPVRTEAGDRRRIPTTQLSEVLAGDRWNVPGADEQLSKMLLCWRTSSNYAQPLLDDRGVTGSQEEVLPTAWSRLVTADGGLADCAVFGLQVWMVVADLHDGAGDLYLAMAAAGQPASDDGEVLVGSFPRPAGNGAGTPCEFATDKHFSHGLRKLPLRKRLIQWEMERSPSDTTRQPVFESKDMRYALPSPLPQTTLPSNPNMTALSPTSNGAAVHPRCDAGAVGSFAALVAQRRP